MHVDGAAALRRERFREHAAARQLRLDQQQRWDRHAPAVAPVVLKDELLNHLVHVALAFVREVEGMAVREHAVAHLEDLRVRVLPLHRHRDRVERPHRLVRDALALHQRLHRAQAVSLDRRLLEFLRRRCRAHALLELALDRLEAALKEVDDGIDPAPVLLLGDVAHARCLAALDVVVQAGGATAAARLRARARAEHEDLREDLERAPHALRVRVRAEVGARGMWRSRVK